MSTDVITAEPVAAGEPSAPITPTEPTSFKELQASWTPDERSTWNRTGEEPTAKPAVPAEKQTPAPEKAEVKPDAGTGDDEDHEPEYFGTPEQIKGQKKAFARLRTQKAELKAELKLLREQRTEKPAAPVAAPRAEVKIEPKGQRPKRPSLMDAKYEGPAGAALYDSDMDAHEEALEVFSHQKLLDEIDKRSSEQTVKASRREESGRWKAEVEKAKETHADFEAVAFDPNWMISWPMIGVIQGMKGGAEIFYQLGKDRALAQELTVLTDIPGKYETYEQLTAAASADPRLARLLGTAEGIVKAEVKRLQSGSTAPVAKPITRTAAIAPGTRVPANSSPSGDPLADAYARNDLQSAMRLENERDLAALRR